MASMKKHYFEEIIRTLSCTWWFSTSVGDWYCQMKHFSHLQLPPHKNKRSRLSKVIPPIFASLHCRSSDKWSRQTSTPLQCPGWHFFLFSAKTWRWKLSMLRGASVCHVDFEDLEFSMLQKCLYSPRFSGMCSLLCEYVHIGSWWNPHVSHLERKLLCKWFSCFPCLQHTMIFFHLLFCVCSPFGFVLNKTQTHCVQLHIHCLSWLC